MDLEPKPSNPAPDYPTYQRFLLSRRAVIGGSAPLLLAAGCGTPKEPFHPEPRVRPRTRGLLAPAQPEPKPKPPVRTRPEITSAE